MPPVEAILEENATLKAELSGKESIIAGKDERIAELEAQIAWFKRQVFAGGKSEYRGANATTPQRSEAENNS